MIDRVFRLSLLLLPLISFSMENKTVSISGTSDYPHALIRLITYGDFLSWQEQTLSYAMTDIDGNFAFKAEISETKNYILALELERNEIFLVPGGRYDLHIPKQEHDPYGSFFDKEPLQFQLNHTDDGGFHAQLSEINLSYNTFVLQHFRTLQRRSRHDLIDSLQFDLEALIDQSQHLYLQDYVTYKMGNLRFTTRNKSPEQLRESLFESKPVLYHNIEYMNLTKELYGNYLTDVLKLSAPAAQQLLAQGYQALDSLMLTRAELASSERLREFAALINLQRLLGNKFFDQVLVVQLIEEISNKSPFPIHRTHAQNIIQQHRRGTYGSPATGFRLSSAGQGHVDLRDLADKYVLISFVKENCLACENALLDLEAFHQQYQDRFHFITIATASSFEQTSRFFKNNRLNWPVLNLGRHILLLEAYQVRTLPEFVLLLPDNKIGMLPAPGPERYLEHHINRILSYE